MEKKKVSIIIPAYNVEKYIGKCIKSIQMQTYQNIEIIVVNDGSTDSTRELINGISKDDKRVIIYNLENSGVSTARNYGLDHCKGDYVVFVDGDDFLAPDFVKYMMTLVEKTGADFCLSKNCFTKINEVQEESNIIEKLNSIDATALLLSPRVIVGCWNKIYSRNFIEENKLRFSNTLFYGEGLSFITTAAQYANYIGVGNRKVYYYRRNNEDSATTRFDEKKYVNGEIALKRIKENMIVHGENIDIMFNLHMALFCLGAICKLKANKKEKKYFKEYKHWKKSLIYYTKKVILKNRVSIYRKCMLIGGCIFPWGLMQLDKIRRKRIVAMSVED